MPTTYDRCDKPDCDVYDRVKAMMEKHHPELHAHEVTVLCLFANSGDDEKPALKAPGSKKPAAALVSIVPLWQRVAGLADSKIVIDELVWNRLSEPQRDALVDHELAHLELQYEGQGVGTPIKTDDWGRPKLKLRVHDYDLSGFKEIMDRHPEASLEKLEAQKWAAEYGGYIFGAATVGVAGEE